jgi:hypothetical protein
MTNNPAPEQTVNMDSVVKEADENIRLFEQWFTKELGESALTSYEQAILKTFLVQKALGKF